MSPIASSGSSPAREDSRTPRPLVGISLCLDDRGRWRDGREYVYADLAYARAVEDAGGTPVQLPLQRDVAVLVDRIDALLLPGGDDFRPTGRPDLGEELFEPAPAAQIDFDSRLLACALDRGLPVLGICYGMQLLALHHGGRLHYHLPADLPEADEHRLPESSGRHALEVAPDTRLASILGTAPAAVNSLHHQAVDRVGTGLRVSARSPDGVVEGLEGEGPGFLLGVQWHPEKLPDDAERLALFRSLVDACRPERRAG